MSKSEPVMFQTGSIYITQGIKHLASIDSSFREFVSKCLARHMLNDWGDLSTFDINVNDNAVKHGGRLLSSYEFNGAKFWIITETCRTVTTILLPEEY